MHSVDLQSLLHTVYRQRQALQTTSVAYCKFRRYDEILILQIKLVGLVWIVGWDWVGSRQHGLGCCRWVWVQYDDMRHDNIRALFGWVGSLAVSKRRRWGEGIKERSDRLLDERSSITSQQISNRSSTGHSGNLEIRRDLRTKTLSGKLDR